MHSFEEYLFEATKVTSPRQLFDLFLREMSEHGYDKILFALLNDHREINQKAGVGIMQNYPTDWMKYYYEHAFDKIDPIARYAVHQVGAFTWAEVEKKVRLMPQQRKCLRLGTEAGLYNGIGVPLRGCKGQIAGISLASSQPKDACHFQADLMTSYCQHFYAVYQRLHQPQPCAANNIILTNREREILTLTALGKSNEEIGRMTKTSAHLVKFYLRQIYDKVGTRSRVEAVVKAIYFGLISL
jgi:DNA-binding CsgD family transcriptional regulator